MARVKLDPKASSMTKSSLSQQLEQLRNTNQHYNAIPIITDRQKTFPSLCFTPSEAAEYDERTIWKLGQNGIDALCKLDTRFFEARAKFYEEEALEGDRALMSLEENAMLDEEIKGFLYLLSPYFMESSAHKALEWMIRKYRIQVLNVDALMQCIIPYHDTVPFVRVLQIINLNGESARHWNFLLEKQKKVSQLTRHFLALRCTIDSELLDLIYAPVKWHVQNGFEHSISFFTLLVIDYLGCFEERRHDPNVPRRVMQMAEEMVSAEQGKLQLSSYAIVISLIKHFEIVKEAREKYLSVAKKHAVDQNAFNILCAKLTDQ